jgi:hypothetical protein
MIGALRAMGRVSWNLCPEGAQLFTLISSCHASLCRQGHYVALVGPELLASRDPLAGRCPCALLHVFLLSGTGEQLHKCSGAFRWVVV